MIAFSYERTKNIGRSPVTEFYDATDQSKCLMNLIPNRKGYFRGEIFQTNSYGMRNREFSISKEKNTFRILVLGDSVTLGTGVPIERTFTSILEDALNGNGDKIRYEIINWSIPDNSDYCMLEQMKFVPTFNPDLIFLTLRDPSLGFVVAHTAIKPKESYIQAILNFQQQTGIAVLLVDNKNILSSFFQEVPKKKIFTVDIAVPYGKEDYIYPIDGHPNARIHALYAQKLFKYFEAHKKELFNRSHPKPITAQLPKIEKILNNSQDNGFLKSYFLEKINQKLLEIKSVI